MSALDMSGRRRSRSSNKWGAGERSAALALYAEAGPTVAAEQTGIPRQTVARWAAAAGIAPGYSSGQAQRVEAMRVRWDERKLDMADNFGATADAARALADRFIAEGKPREAQAAITTAAIAADKAQLLSGYATSRSESRTLTVGEAVAGLKQMIPVSSVLSASTVPAGELPAPADV